MTEDEVLYDNADFLFYLIRILKLDWDNSPGSFILHNFGSHPYHVKPELVLPQEVPAGHFPAVRVYRSKIR